MRSLERRVQLPLDEPRNRKVTGEARSRHVLLAAVIREAIDRPPAEADRRRTAIADILVAEPMPLLADSAELRRLLAAPDSAPDARTTEPHQE